MGRRVRHVLHAYAGYQTLCHLAVLYISCDKAIAISGFVNPLMSCESYFQELLDSITIYLCEKKITGLGTRTDGVRYLSYHKNKSV